MTDPTEMPDMPRVRPEAFKIGTTRVRQGLPRIVFTDPNDHARESDGQRDDGECRRHGDRVPAC